LNNDESVGLVKYYKSFKSTYGALAALFTAIPLWSKAVPEGYGAYIFPPVASLEGPARIGIFAVAVVGTYLAFMTRGASPRGGRIRTVVALLFALLFIFVYLSLFHQSVRVVDIPTRNISVLVTVGRERTDFAKKNFDGQSDSDMLYATGIHDADVRELWTPDSLRNSRLSLCLAYAGVILCLVMAFSWGVASELRKSKAAVNV
jgi:hypothetical protein